MAVVDNHHQAIAAVTMGVVVDVVVVVVDVMAFQNILIIELLFEGYHHLLLGRILRITCVRLVTYVLLKFLVIAKEHLGLLTIPTLTT